jgi:hypothetical protein
MWIEHDENDNITFSLEGKDWGQNKGKAFIKRLQEVIPEGSRNFDKGTKSWLISYEYAKAFYTVAKSYFDIDVPPEYAGG